MNKPDMKLVACRRGIKLLINLQTKIMDTEKAVTSKCAKLFIHFSDMDNNLLSSHVMLFSE